MTQDSTWESSWGRFFHMAKHVSMLLGVAAILIHGSVAGTSWASSDSPTSQVYAAGGLESTAPLRSVSRHVGAYPDVDHSAMGIYLGKPRQTNTGPAEKQGREKGYESVGTSDLPHVEWTAASNVKREAPQLLFAHAVRGADTEDNIGEGNNNRENGGNGNGHEDEDNGEDEEEKEDESGWDRIFDAAKLG
jgi:hypothetical protein